LGVRGRVYEGVDAVIVGGGGGGLAEGAADFVGEGGERGVEGCEVIGEVFLGYVVGENGAGFWECVLEGIWGERVGWWGKYHGW